MIKTGYKILLISLLSVFGFVNVQAQDCQAKFGYSVESEISSLTYKFVNLSVSTSPVINYYWEFGDGSSSVKENPEHQYLTEGSFVVQLTIYTSDSCSSVYRDTIQVVKVVIPGCMAYYTYIHLTQSASYTYAFTDHSVPASGDTIIAWHWNFDDGGVSYIQNPIHQFMSTGNFNVSLTIYTTAGCNSTYSFVITIYNGSSPCQASFTATQDTSGNVLKYHFHDNSVHSTNIVSWRWNFDDGDSSLVQDPDHVFPYAGLYFVSLEIITSGGCQSRISYPVQVGNPQPYNVWGRVYAGPYVIDKCIAYLYKEFNNNYYKPVDTVRLTSVNDTLGVYYFFQIPEGKHKVKVLLPDNSTYSGDYAPTYYGDKLQWKKGSTINLFQDISAANINLVPVTVSGGNCVLKAKIISTNQAMMSTENVEVLLFDSYGNPAGYTFSDNQGIVTFDGLAQGSYFVYGEVTGLFSNMINVNFNSSNDTIDNLVINIGDNSITGFFLLDGKRELKYEVFPNPATDFLTLTTKGIDGLSPEIMVEVIDLKGSVKWSRLYRHLADRKLTIPVGYLDTGIYLLKLTDIQSNKTSAVKFLKK